MASKQFTKTWWGEKWLNALEGVYWTNRIGRGRTYANTGRVYDINISGNSVTAKVGDTDYVKEITFNGYDRKPEDISDGWLNLSGLKVTLKTIPQGWDKKSVVFKLNDSITKTVDFVPAKKLSASNITLLMSLKTS